MDPVTGSLMLGGLSSATNVGSQLLGNYSGRKAGKRAAKYARWNAAWAAQNLPALQMKGLRDAGLNPILAAGSGRNTQMPSPQNMATGSPGQSNVAGGYKDISSAQLFKNQNRVAKAQAEREEKVNAYWNTHVGREFIVPMAAASAAGVNVRNVSDAVLLPSLIRSANSAEKLSNEKSLWDRVKDWHKGNVKRYNPDYYEFRYPNEKK